MKKTELINGMTRTFNRVGFKIKKHSPEILMVGGVIGVVTSTVMACKATTRLECILDDTREKVDAIHAASENGNVSGVEYTKEDGKKDLTIVYAQTGLELVKLYGPAVALGTLSIASMCMSNGILRKRNVALAAAYTAIDKGFKDYRGRVIERFGKELDRELRFDIKAKEIEETVIDENGKEKKVKKTVNVADAKIPSDYSKFFDEACAGWDKDPDYNLMFLKQQQAWANDLLKSQGHLYLNEVYDMLGIPRTKAGNVVGWIYDEKNPIGDNYVDFGIYDQCGVEARDTAKRDFVNGYERSILLDFNVDGDILSLMQ